MSRLTRAEIVKRVLIVTSPVVLIALIVGMFVIEVQPGLTVIKVLLGARPTPQKTAPEFQRAFESAAASAERYSRMLGLSAETGDYGAKVNRMPPPSAGFRLR
jgi:hypothetical protein